MNRKPNTKWTWRKNNNNALAHNLFCTHYFWKILQILKATKNSLCTYIGKFVVDCLYPSWDLSVAQVVNLRGSTAVAPCRTTNTWYKPVVGVPHAGCLLMLPRRVTLVHSRWLTAYRMIKRPTYITPTSNNEYKTITKNYEINSTQASVVVTEWSFSAKQHTREQINFKKITK